MLHCIRNQRNKWPWSVQGIRTYSLSSTITSNVLLSSACSAIDDEVVEKGNTKTKRWNVLNALIVAGVIRYVRKEDK